MHEKELGRLAKVLPHLAARWRWPADLETLAGLPDGEVVVDVLAGTARHAQAGPINLRLTEELKAGFSDQLTRNSIAPAFVEEALVVLKVDTGAVRTDRDRIVHFDFRISAHLRSPAGGFSGEQEELHVWHSRAPD